ncbi:MAG: FtsW/RodA/SpoVE family cell cycle protein [Propionibacteriaceae bacterium]|jgi:cell division protein FtsW (lipid II flippase)|nr:FtsW/RodA/SpoVE family cell cycle protein [Propionibacteriaceae bacterium]
MAADRSAASAVGRPRRRNTELVLILIGQAVGFAGYLLIGLFQDNALPSGWPWAAAIWFGLGLATHLVIRLRAPYADPVLMPLVLALIGLGLAELHRIDLIAGRHRAETQLVAIGLGLACFVAVLVFLRDPRRLRGYPYLLSAAGLALLLLPLVPGLGRAVNGSRIWINLLGFSFQPAEVAKIVLAASFAAYLTEKRDVLSRAGHRVLGLDLPRARDLGPILVMWAVSLAILVFENDLGTSLLFFGLFVMVLYVATGQVSWIVLALGLTVAGGVAAYRLFGHVRLRVAYWLDPFATPDQAGQIINGQYGLANGGLFGAGWGLGRPGLTVFSWSDMMPTSLGEEIGLVGLMGIVVCLGLVAFRGLKTALMARDVFIKLLAAGLSFGFILQTFAIVGGSTRLLPLTGLTTPFLSQGGSSMIANWILVALLVQLSHQVRHPAASRSEVPATVSAGGVTDLQNENTQVISTKQLLKVGQGQVRPLLAIAGGQVPLSAGPAAAAGISGAEEATAAIDRSGGLGPRGSTGAEEATEAIDRADTLDAGRLTGAGERFTAAGIEQATEVIDQSWARAAGGSSGADARPGPVADRADGPAPTGLDPADQEVTRALDRPEAET